MKESLKNTVGIILGLFVGGLVNMALVLVSTSFIIPQEGLDLSNSSALEQAIPLFDAKHFIFPFLAHALGTLSAALIAILIAESKYLQVALITSAFFLGGGIINIFSIPAPLWFIIADLILAYVPMGYLAYIIIGKKKAKDE